MAYICAFVAPVIILLLILICGKVFPFGKQCYLRTDMYHQYAPFLSEFREKLQTGGSLLYSWDIGLGVNFTSLYAYYLASPFNWLVVLCPRQYVIEFMTVMTVVKAGLAGLSMVFYLKHKTKNPDFGLAYFGIFYALSGYMCAYYWNVMWMDCIILFPIIMYGFEKMLRGESGLIYALSLGVSILSNYYISIMICMFLVIYFFAYQFIYKPENIWDFIKRGMNFALFSLIAGGISAVLLLPEIAALSQTASSDINFPKTFSAYFSIAEMFARHLPMVETEQALNHWPNIYMGIMVFLLLPIYLVTPRIKLSEKAVYLSMVFIFLTGFSVNVFNFIWHGLHYPNSLPARQSFIYIFLMLYICFRTYSVRAFITKKQLMGALLFAIGFVLYSENEIENKQFAFWIFYLAIILLVLYTAVIAAYLKRSISTKKAALWMLVLVLFEVTGNAAYTSITTTSREAYTEDNENVRALVDSLFPASDFFRIEKMNPKTKNDGAWMNFPSVSLFSSMANADCSALFKKLGCEASTNAYSIKGSTPFVNMLFSVKYSIYDSAQENGEEKSFIESRGESYLYKNNYALPLGFTLPKDFDNWVMELDDPALVQNSICDMLGTPHVLVPNTEIGNSNGRSYAATIGEDGEYYAYIKNNNIKKVTAKYGDKEKTFEHVNRGYLLELGMCYESDLVKIEAETDTNDLDVQLYRFDYKALKEAYEQLSQEPLRLTVWEDDRIKGDVTVTGDELEVKKLFMSIPFDEGWTVKVDGKEVLPIKLFDTFMGLELTVGQHEIELSFMPKGLKIGAIVSVFSFLLLIAVTIIQYFVIKKKNANLTESYYDDEDYYDDE
ncbi:MAG: YfhO family protein, partial [Eubacteriales bacterium]|nr:YfhO family protein [Eubacteriales bacterium]